VTESQADAEMIVDGLLSFVRKIIVPLERANAEVLEDPRRTYDADGRPTPEWSEARRQARMAAAEAGYYALFAPVDIGGGGQGAVLSYMANHALYHEFGPGRVLVEDAIGKWNRGPSGLIRLFSTQLRGLVADDLLSGRDIFCFALSEPDAGSDAWALVTRAERTKGGWIINGVKQWISDSPYADHALVFVSTDEQAKKARQGGISAFFVPMTAPGLKVASVIKLFGEIGGTRAILTFDDVFVPDHALVGEEGSGFDLARAGVSLGRMYNAGRAVGTARWALAKAVEYAQDRRTFGQPIATYQAIQFMLADSATEIYAAHTMALDCAQRIDAGQKVDKQLAMVKSYSSDMSFTVMDRCVQVHGGMGLVNETRLTEGWHAQRVSRLVDGSDEIMRRNVARALLRGDLGL
jgi:acyl-CoA dehydrogenase